MKQDLQILFTPAQIGACMLKNRFVMAPMGPAAMCIRDSLVGMIILYLCIPSQIAENLVARATISPRFFPTFSVLGVIVCCALLLVFDAKEHIFSHKTAEAAATQEKKEEISYVRVVLVADVYKRQVLHQPRQRGW